MSKPRYKWYGYVRAIARDYRRLSDRHVQLTAAERRELDAISEVITATEQRPDGDIRMAVVRMVLFDGSHDLQGAAMAVSVSYRTARRMISGFLVAIAKNLKLL